MISKRSDKLTTTEKINDLLGINDAYQTPARLLEILYDKQRRESLFMRFLEAFNYDVSYDWFHEYFQEEHADRRNKKQDFTPRSVAELVTRLVGDDGRDFYEPCAGTGGMTIARWDRDRRQHSPFDYKPSWYVYICEELSDRALPFLLFNVMIRGMNAAVVHCDVLSRKAYGAFFVQNDNDDHLQFSNLYRFPYSDAVADYFAIEFVEERYAEADTPGELPAHIFGDIKLADIKEAMGAIS